MQKGRWWLGVLPGGSDFELSSEGRVGVGRMTGGVSTQKK